MKKITLSIIGVLTAISCILLVSHEIMAQNENPTIQINGVLLETVEPLYNRDGRILAPMRFILEPLGFSIKWNENTQTVTATNNTHVVKITVGKSIILINDVEIVLDVKAQHINDRVYVPVRFSGGLVGTVEWDSQNQIVNINPNNTIDNPVENNNEDNSHSPDNNRY